MSAGEGVRPPGSRDKGDTARFVVILLVAVSASRPDQDPCRRSEEELRRRRVRRKKLAALRSRYEHAKDEGEKAAVLKKLVTIAPWLALEFREEAEPAAPPAEEIGRTKKAK
jgi:hypothetical protein